MEQILATGRAKPSPALHRLTLRIALTAALLPTLLILPCSVPAEAILPQGYAEDTALPLYQAERVSFFDRVDPRLVHPERRGLLAERQPPGPL